MIFLLDPLLYLENAIFYEYVFPYSSPTSSSNSDTVSSSNSTNSLFLFDFSYQLRYCTDPSSTSHNAAPHRAPLPSIPDTTTPEPITDSPFITEFLVADSTPITESVPVTVRKSSRPSNPPSYLKDFHCNLTSSTPTHLAHTPYPLSSVLSYSRLSPSHLHYTLFISATDDPTTYRQAIKHSHWVQAMQHELSAFHLNNTWTLVDLPQDKTPICCKWVYRTKYKADALLKGIKPV